MKNPAQALRQRLTLGGIGALIVITAHGCFPKLPPEDDTDIADGTSAQEDGVIHGDGGPEDDTVQLDVAATDVPVSIDVPEKECETPADCESLAGVCQVAACTNHSCVVIAASDTTTCDDNNLCTELDLCTPSGCFGTPKVCEAVSQCHLVGTCEATTGNCSTPTKLDATACDDENVCTVTDTCRSGICTGVGKPPLGLDTGVAMRAAPGSAVIVGAVAGTQDFAVATLFTEGTEIETVQGSGEPSPLGLPENSTCQLSILKTPIAHWDLRLTPFARTAGACAHGDESILPTGMVVLPDTTLVLSGFIEEPMELTAGRGRKLGESASGLIHETSYFLARVTTAGALAWTLEFLGVYGDADPDPMPRGLAANSAGLIAVAIPVRPDVTSEFLDRDGVVQPLPTLTGVVASVLATVELDGSYRELAQLTASPGGVLTSAVMVADDGEVGAAGIVFDGVMTVKDSSGAETQMGTGLTAGQPEAWVTWFKQDGTLAWGRQIFVDPAFSGSMEEVMTVAANGAIDNHGTVWFAFGSWGPLVSRVGTDAGTPLTADAWPTSRGFRTTLVGFDLQTGAVRDGRLLGGEFHMVEAISTVGSRVYFAGSWQGTYSHRSGSPDSTNVFTPYVAALDDWLVKVARAGPAGTDFLGFSEVDRGVMMAKAGTSLFTATNLERSANVEGNAGPFLLDIQENGGGVAFRRVNTAGALDCD